MRSSAAALERCSLRPARGGIIGNHSNDLSRKGAKYGKNPLRLCLLYSLHEFGLNENGKIFCDEALMVFKY